MRYLDILGIATSRQEMTVPHVSIDAERVLFDRELGLALAAWASVEKELFFILLSCIPDNAHPVIGRGYMSLGGFNTKLNFVDSSVKRSTGDAGPNCDAWKSLAGKLRKENQRRNEIAHNDIQIFPTTSVGNRVASCPWTFPKSWDRKAPHAKCLTTMDVVVIRMQFVVLARLAENFRYILLGSQPLYGSSDLHPARLPPFRQLVIQLCAEIGPPPLSAKEKRSAIDEATAAASLTASATARP